MKKKNNHNARSSFEALYGESLIKQKSKISYRLT